MRNTVFVVFMKSGMFLYTGIQWKTVNFKGALLRDIEKLHLQAKAMFFLFCLMTYHRITSTSTPLGAVLEDLRYTNFQCGKNSQKKYFN